MKVADYVCLECGGHRSYGSGLRCLKCFKLRVELRRSFLGIKWQRPFTGRARDILQNSMLSCRQTKRRLNALIEEQRIWVLTEPPRSRYRPSTRYRTAKITSSIKKEQQSVFTSEPPQEYKCNARKKVAIFLDSPFIHAHGDSDLQGWHDIIPDVDAADPLELLIEQESIKKIVRRVMNEWGISKAKAYNLVGEYL